MSEEVKNIYMLPINEQYIEKQKALNGKIIPAYRVDLTPLSFKILKAIYYSTKPLTHGNIYAILNAKVSFNTIRRAIDLFEDNHMIKRVKDLVYGPVNGTIADSRYRYYIITAEGINEFENQIERKRWD